METKNIDIKSLYNQMEKENEAAVPKQRFHLPYIPGDIYLLLGQYYKAEVLKRVERDKYQPLDEPMKRLLSNVSVWLCAPDKRPGLLLYGNVGTGKTTILLAIRSLINRLCKREQDGNGRIEQVLDEPFPMSAVKAKQVVSDHTLNRSRYDLMCRVAMLAIDELGVENVESRQYGNVSEPIIDLLAERYDRQLLTIVSTNMGMNEIRERYGVRILDRFNEMFTALPFNGKSYRQ